MKQVTVSGAIILRTNPLTQQKEIFATQRGYGEYKDGWEIPGGKLEPGETPEQCIVREIQEELQTTVHPVRELGIVDYDYPTFHLTMHCILCTIVSGELKLLEHEAARWLNKENLHSVDWLPADQLILDKIDYQEKQKKEFLSYENTRNHPFYSDVCGHDRQTAVPRVGGPGCGSDLLPPWRSPSGTDHRDH